MISINIHIHSYNELSPSTIMNQCHLVLTILHILDSQQVIFSENIYLNMEHDKIVITNI